MCGIAGILSANPANRDAQILDQMMGAIAHRGPDDAHQYQGQDISLGFRRLSIIDLSTGRQPMTTQDRRYTIVFNGEIYNYRELRAELEPFPAYEFVTHSDTEVILFAIAQWGFEAVRRFNGMFSMAIWDSYERRLTFARDRIGKKPLYYFLQDDCLVFASEVKSLREHPLCPRRPSRPRIATSLVYRYVPGEETLFEGIHAFPAAHFAHINADAPYALEFHRYWSPSPPAPVKQSLTDPQAINTLDARLSTAVERRMVADVPVGAFLSGGIDSSLIVAMMADASPQNVKTFSVGFDTGFSEHEFARQVAKQFNTDHEEIVVSADDLLRAIPAVLWHRETPITEPSDIPLYLLSERASKSVKVVLSGEGSDELFCGYPKYAAANMAQSPAGGLLRALAKQGKRTYCKKGLSATKCIAATALSEPHFAGASAAWFGGFTLSHARQIWQEAASCSSDFHDVFAYAAGADTRTGTENLQSIQANLLRRMQQQDLAHWLPANLLLRGDRMTMAHGLELRCPFLDPEVIGFALKCLKDRQRVRLGSTKWIVRKLAERRLPPEISARKKWGFKVPVGEWLRGPLRSSLEQTLFSDRAIARSYFNQTEIRRLADEHLAGRNHTKQLWYLYQLELWHQMFIDGQLSPTDSL